MDAGAHRAGLAAQQRHQHLGVVRVSLVHAGQQADRLGVTAGAPEGERVGAGERRAQREAATAYVGERAVTRDRGDPAEQVVGPVRGSQCRPRVTLR